MHECDTKTAFTAVQLDGVAVFGALIATQYGQTMERTDGEHLFIVVCISCNIYDIPAIYSYYINAEALLKPAPNEYERNVIKSELAAALLSRCANIAWRT